jgi:hypothetical protein
MTSAHAITSTLGSLLHLLPRWLRLPSVPLIATECPGDLPEAGTPPSARRLDDEAADLAGLRAAARRLGVLPPEGVGWFGALVRDRLRRSLAERTARDWDALYPGASVEERAARRIASAARKAALSGGLSAAGAHVGEALTVLTEGLTAPMCMPAVALAISAEVVASAKVQIDLVFDLASIHGVAFDLDDTAELATIFELALHGGGVAPGGEGRPPEGDAILARLGRALLEDALLGLVPLVGIPYSAVHGHRATARVGAVACRRLRGRVALREALRGALSRASPELLLEGAWLLAVVDGVATGEELFLVAALARGVAPEASQRLDAIDERGWLARAASLEPRERAALLDALVVAAGLRGPTRHPERCFLIRVGEALGLAVDFARIEAIQRQLGDVPAAS